VVESGDNSSGEADIGPGAGLDRERGDARRIPDVGSFLESLVIFESTEEIDVCLLRPDLCGRDGPFERAGFVGVEGRTERPISRGFVG